MCSSAEPTSHRCYSFQLHWLIHVGRHFRDLDWLKILLGIKSSSLANVNFASTTGFVSGSHAHTPIALIALCIENLSFRSASNLCCYIKDAMGIVYSTKGATDESLEARDAASESVRFASHHHRKAIASSPRNVILNNGPYQDACSRRLMAEEEKVPDTRPSVVDFKSDPNLAITIMTMCTFGRHFSWTTSVHPADDDPPSCVTIESLPPPLHEARPRGRRSSSLPVRCPPAPSQDGEDAEYLSKVYDMRTWNMYELINDSRKRRQVSYHPSATEEEHSEERLPETPTRVSESSLHHNMIFDFDFE